MFYDENSIKQILNCEYCKQRLIQPKVLPCSATLCIRCVNLIEHFVFTCPICNDPHIKPHDGFPANKAIENILQIQPTEIMRSQTVESFKHSLTDLLNRINQLSNINTTHLRHLFDGSKEEVQQATQLLLDRIKLFYDQFMSKINEYEHECLKISETNKQELKKTFKEMLELHNEWSEYLKQYQEMIDDSDKSTSKPTENIAYHVVDDETSCSTDLLSFGRHNDESDCETDRIVFQEPNIEMSTETNNQIVPVTQDNALGFIVGQTLNLLHKGFNNKTNEMNTFNSANAHNLNSTIMNKDQIIDLMNLCGFSTEQEWTLVYRASRDGFTAADFHSRCDPCANTLIVIKSAQNNIFGGYTEADWSGDDGYKSDDNTFLFSLINRENQPLVIKCIRQENAIYVKQGKL